MDVLAAIRSEGQDHRAQQVCGLLCDSGQRGTGYLRRDNAVAMSSAIILRLLFSMKKLGPAWR